MKVLMLNGSPNKNGCTWTALHEIEKTLALEGIDSEIVNVGGESVSGCLDCGGCRGGECVCDDIVNVLIEKLKAADGFIVGSPVYYSSPNGTLISILDRMFHSNAKNFANKPAAAVVSARRAGTTASLDVLTKYFTISCMPVVSSSYWSMIHGNTAEEAARDAEGLQTMRNIAHNMAWLLKSIEAGKAAGIAPPVRERGNVTNFMR